AALPKEAEFSVCTSRLPGVPANSACMGGSTMDANEFKPGDLVRVRSGGPIMTVEQVGKTAMLQEDAIWCVWFEKVGNRQVARKETFAPIVLEKTEKPRASFSASLVRG